MTTPPPDDLAFPPSSRLNRRCFDLSVPWIYNTATYETKRDGYIVQCEIQAAYSTLEITLTFGGGGQEIAEAEVAASKELEIVTDNGRETLIDRFGNRVASALYLTLKPHARLSVLAGSHS